MKAKVPPAPGICSRRRGEVAGMQETPITDWSILSPHSKHSDSEFLAAVIALVLSFEFNIEGRSISPDPSIWIQH